MKKTLTAKAYLPILLIAVLVLLTPVYVAQADIGLWLYNNLVLAGFGKILGWAGLILDYAINTFVIGFGTQMSTNLGVVVNTTWATVRDLFNLTFIFGLVYIGFKMILRTDDSNSRKWLINLIIAALLVNFSLFITKFVIDFSNILAVEVINLGITEDVFDSTGGFVQISTSMQNSIGVVTTAGEVEGADAAEGEITMSMVLGTIMIFLVAAFVYFSAGILLIVRAAVLIVLMILSPFLFIGMVLPMFQSTATQLWSTLFKRAFLAPIYIIFLYLSLKLSEDIFTGSFAGMFSATDGSDVLTGATTAFGPFILVVALLLMSLTAAQKMGAEGAGAMISMGHKMRQRGQRAVKSSARWTASQTAGRGARFASEKAGRSLNRGLQNLQRRDGRLGSIARSNAVTGTVGAGAAAMQQTKFGLKRTREEDRKMRNQTEERVGRDREVRDRAAPPIDMASTAAQVGARQEARRQQQTQVGRMGNDEIIERARLNPEEVMSPEFASLMSDAQATALKESGVLDSEQNDQLDANRDQGTFDEINNVLQNRQATEDQLAQATEDLGRAVSTLSDERIKNMDQATLERPEVASQLTDKQLDVRRDSGASSAAEMRAIRDSKRDAQLTILNNGSLANPGSPGASAPAFQERQRRRLFKNAQTAGKMDVDVLSRPEASQYLTPQIVGEFMNNNPSQPDINQLRGQIQNYMMTGGSSHGYDEAFDRWTKRTVEGRQFDL